MAEGFNPPGLWLEENPGYCQGVVQPEGRVIYMTGQVAWNSDLDIVGKGDVGAQTEQCFRNIETLLAAVGGTLDDIVSMTIFFTIPDQRAAISAVRNRAFPTGRAPVSIYIQAAGLVHPDLLVELVPIAVVPHERYREPA